MSTVKSQKEKQKTKKTIIFIFGLGSTHANVERKLKMIRDYLGDSNQGFNVEAYFADGFVLQLWQVGLIYAAGESPIKNKKRQIMVSTITNRVIELTQDPNHHVTLIGHSLGGYYTSAIVHQLATTSSLRQESIRWENIRAFTLGTIGIHPLPLDRPIPILNIIFANDLVTSSKLLKQTPGLKIPKPGAKFIGSMIVDQAHQIVWLKPVPGFRNVHSMYLERVVFAGLLMKDPNANAYGNFHALLDQILKIKFPDYAGSSSSQSRLSGQGMSGPCLL